MRRMMADRSGLRCSGPSPHCSGALCLIVAPRSLDLGHVRPRSALMRQRRETLALHAPSLGDMATVFTKRRMDRPECAFSASRACRRRPASRSDDALPDPECLCLLAGIAAPGALARRTPPFRAPDPRLARGEGAQPTREMACLDRHGGDAGGRHPRQPVRDDPSRSVSHLLRCGALSLDQARADTTESVRLARHDADR